MANELTNIEIIVFEDDDGGEIEMEIIDEFDCDGAHYIALSEVPDADSDALLDEDDISFFLVTQENDEEMFDLVEDKKLLQQLADLLEQRLLKP